MPIDIQIQELDTTGYNTANYRYDAYTGGFELSTPAHTVNNGKCQVYRYLSPFLPAGYPSSVTDDYTPYQIYDSLQAFASTIAGLLASRAVFVGMGVGSEDASVITTMLLYIAQATIGRIATIAFADRFSQQIEANVKFYRFFADIVNDAAFVLDCISPHLPILGRAITLCVSNACRALCGVAGGSSKAILSTHFAKAGNIGELNAKDGSQETVVSLIGMWVGGLVVSKVEGIAETWCCMIPLLALHLWCNWKAVKSVRLSTLNTERAVILFDGVLQGQTKSLDEVGKQEGILGKGDMLRTAEGRLLSSCKVGASVDELLRIMRLKELGVPGRPETAGERLARLLEVFHEEEYLLWADITTGQAVIILKEDASVVTQAKGFLHLMRLANSHSPLQKDKTKRMEDPQKSIMMPQQDDEILKYLEQTLHENSTLWPAIKDRVQAAGWELEKGTLEQGPSYRVRMCNGPDSKKDK
ncbi:uncharacterized protein A1O9_07613 [Exophiala aquamarina CBS 119918]|uniref:DUF647 domain-containing protein n=1 Tax=Exophiala aquamarina CBS 119918 TaxID=1182545 RepID=A0A072P8F2_9EURO|nr:uncharacterized protein A1O9_07613 [Exophiala aquamarina CBS 119918]KEF56032.1 hypothetical protein A1O9_07613 [Exophiala aquamarina CBS 119918]